MVQSSQQLRSLCIDCLQNRALSMSQRILLMGMQLQKVLDHPEQIAQILQEFEARLEQAELVAQQLVLPQNEQEVLLCLHQHMKTLVRVWQIREVNDFLVKLIRCTCREQEEKEFILDITYQDYLAAKQRMEKTFGDLEYFFENLAVHLFFYLGQPQVKDEEEFWKGYVNFCNVYSLFRFAAVMTCLEGMPADKETLFNGLVTVSRNLIHSRNNQDTIRDEFFANESTSLAHMAVLLSL